LNGLHDNVAEWLHLCGGRVVCHSLQIAKKATPNGARYQGGKLVCSRSVFLGCSEAWRWRC
jgi:hypothetical protein